MLVIWKSGATETIDRWQEKVNYSEALWRYAWVRPFLPVAEPFPLDRSIGYIPDLKCLQIASGRTEGK